MLIEKLDIIEEKIERPIWWVSSTLLVGITLLAFVAVVMRYFFSEAYFWLDETCRYGFISVVVLWSGPIMQDDGHIKFDLFVAKLRGKAKYIHQFIVDVFISITCFLIAYWGISIIQMSYMLDETSDSFVFHIWWIHAIIAIGMVIHGVYALLEAIKALMNIRNR